MNSKRYDKASILLNSCGLRKTIPRLEILSVLLEQDGPLTQEQIAGRIGKTAPDKTTIYRSLVKLTEHNLVHQAYIHNRTRYFETAHHCRANRCHPHFTCILCNKTHCLTNAHAPGVKDLPAGFQIHRQQTRLEGICADCQTKNMTK